MADRISATIRAIFEDQLCLEPEEFKETLSLEYDLNMDKIDRTELVMDIEETFDIEIPDEESDGWQYVYDVFKSVKEHKQ